MGNCCDFTTVDKSADFKMNPEEKNSRNIETFDDDQTKTPYGEEDKIDDKLPHALTKIDTIDNQSLQSYRN